MVDKKPSEREEDWSDPSISPLHLGRKLAWGEERIVEKLNRGLEIGDSSLPCGGLNVARNLHGWTATPVARNRINAGISFATTRRWTTTNRKHVLVPASFFSAGVLLARKTIFERVNGIIFRGDLKEYPRRNNNLPIVVENATWNVSELDQPW